MKYKHLAIGSGSAALIGGILALVLNTEGGYVNHPSDPGGETNYGITETTYGGSVRDLTKEQAMTIYESQYIKIPGFLRYIEDQPVLGYKLVDIGVNAGTKRSIRWFQEALNSLSRGCRDYSCIQVDGTLGKRTEEAYRALQRRRGKEESCQLILKILDAKQGHHYLTRPHGKDFMVGWFTERIGNAPLEECQP